MRTTSGTSPTSGYDRPAVTSPRLLARDLEHVLAALARFAPGELQMQFHALALGRAAQLERAQIAGVQLDLAFAAAQLQLARLEPVGDGAQVAGNLRRLLHGVVYELDL